MHNALLISEVLGSIFDFLAGLPAEDTEEAGRQALAVLARTCRAFSEPALNALWHRLRSLKPFMLCLPTTKASYDDEVDEALPPFNEEEWKTVLRHTSRVRVLILKHDDLSMKILQSLWFRTTLLLPNLRKLHWVYGDHPAIASIRLLLSPSLVHLHVWLDEGSDHTSILGFLKSYYTSCPNLRSLYFGHSGRYPRMMAAISRAISRPPNLEALSCGGIDEAALIHTARSRCLKKFACSLFSHEPDTLRRLAGDGTLDHPPFENLRVLELCIKDVSSIIPYFRSQHQPFEEVTIDFHTELTPRVLHEFFTVLSSTMRCRTLRRIDLSRSCLTTGTSIQPINFQVLSPLTTLNLHKFVINIKNPISLNDDDFVRLVQAWPELMTFHLNDRSGWNHPPSLQLPTLKGLLLLLARCPKLHSLGLCLDARSIPSLSEDESSIRNTAITKLSITNSRIQEPTTSVAHFLLEHLPSLIRVSLYSAAPGRMYRDYWMWRDVGKEINKMARRVGPEWDDHEIEVV